MKKVLTVGIICTMLFASTMSVNAAGTPVKCHIGGCNLGECFMDTDCDGICGNHNFVDENNDGICDNHCYLDENEDGICDHYVDEDADGICDHCHDHGKPVQSGSCVKKSQKSGTTGRHGRHHNSKNSGHHKGHC